MENYESYDLTAISFDSVVPAPPERRTEERQTTLLRVGKLVTAQDERLCMIRNISSAGAMIKLYQPIGPGEAIQVEVTPDCPVAATVIWERDDLAGIAFDRPIDVIAALRGGSRDNPYRRVTRTPRLQIRRTARICTEEFEVAVQLCDVSLKGAKFEFDDPLPIDSELGLFVDGLPALCGRVRWWKDGRAGIEFDIPLQMDMLAEWVGASAGQDNQPGGDGGLFGTAG